MADDIKQYAPTARRLERLRELGLSPASAAVSAVAVLLVATGVAVVGGGALRQWLREMMAHDLQVVMVAPQSLPQLLARRLLAGGLIITGTALGAAGVGVLAQMLQGNSMQHSSKRLYLPMSPGGGARRRQSPGLSLGPGLVGLGALVVLMASWLQQSAATGHWPGWEQLAQAAGMWLRWLGVLAAVAVLHAVAVRWRVIGQARMTHRELLEERRETEGSWLKRRRPAAPRAATDSPPTQRRPE